MSHDRPQTAKATTLDLGVRRLVGLLSDNGVDPAPLLRRVGLCGFDLSRRNRLIPVEAEAGLIEAATLTTGDTAFGIRLAEATNPRDAGLLFYLFKTSATVRQALALQSRYMRVWNANLQMAISESTGGDASVDLRHFGLRRREINRVVEFHSVNVIRILREIAGRTLSPARVEFAHRRSFGIGAFERYFGCPARFGGVADRLVFSKETLDLALPGADDRLHEILRSDADRAAAARIGPTASFRVAVENEIQNRLPSGSTSMDAIADALGTSARSLSRRLNEEGTSYSELLDALRRTLALQYVVDPGLSVERAASLLGYGDVAAFTHAFRRWTGRSPSSVRANPSGLAPSADDHRRATPAQGAAAGATVRNQAGGV